MKMLALKTTVFLLIMVAADGLLRIQSEWAGGFHATINIPVTRNVTDDEWEVQVQFDQPVTIDAWPVNFKSKVNNSNYTFKNKFYNGRLLSGSTLDFGFIVYGGLELTPKNLLSIIFDGQQVDISKD